MMIQFESDMEVVAEACNGREAVESYRIHRPDVTLMDLRMPEMDGVEAITAIRSQSPRARIILLTTYDGVEETFQGLRAGALAYLLKDAPCEEILDAVRAIHAGQKRITLDVGARLAERAGSPELTERELDVLRLMVQGRSNQEIAADLGIAEGTVKFHINHILNKLNADDRTQAVVTALKSGLASLG